MKPFALVSIEECREIDASVKRKKKPKPEAPVYPAATDPVTVRLGFPPMLNHYYRIIRIGKHGALKISSRGVAYKATVRELWAKVARSYEGRLAVRVNVYWPNERRGDLDGTLKALLDALQEAGAYANDSQVKLLVVEEHAVEKPGWVDVTIGPKPGVVQGTLFDARR